jgi:hypothetical protein
MYCVIKLQHKVFGSYFDPAFYFKMNNLLEKYNVVQLHCHTRKENWLSEVKAPSQQI